MNHLYPRYIRQTLVFACLCLGLFLFSAPQSAMSQGVTSSVRLAWNPSPGSDVVGYKLYTKTAVGTYGLGTDVGNVTTTMVPDLSAGTSYYFKVTAYNTTGLESVASNEVAYLVPNPTPAPTPVPTPLPTATPLPTPPGPLPTATPLSTPGPGLLASYSLNEGSGTIATDSSGNGLNGTIQGASWTNDGRYGVALDFSSSNSFVNLGNPSSLQITGSMTWSAWVKASSNPPGDGQIVAKSDGSTGWQLKTTKHPEQQHVFTVAVSGGIGGFAERDSTTIRSLDVWYHVAGVYDAEAGTLNIYVNGVLDNGPLSGIITSSQINSPVDVNIGGRSGGSSFDGVIDEVRLYNRALSESEIQADMITAL